MMNRMPLNESREIDSFVMPVGRWRPGSAARKVITIIFDSSIAVFKKAGYNE